MNASLTRLRAASIVAAFTFSAISATVSLAADGGGTIKGKVTFEGTKPTPKQLDMAAEKVCLAAHTDPVYAEKTVVGPKNEVQWAFVYVSKGLEGKKFDTPTKAIQLEQKGCMYHPHVFGMMAGQPIDIVNNDPVLHNIHSLPKDNDSFNVGQPVQGEAGKATKTFAKEELKIKVKCDVHPWMSCQVYVLSHPFFAVSDAGGAFEIAGLPAGTYGISIGHEKWTAGDQTVEVKAGETKQVDFVLKAASEGEGEAK